MDIESCCCRCEACCCCSPPLAYTLANASWPVPQRTYAVLERSRHTQLPEFESCRPEPFGTEHPGAAVAACEAHALRGHGTRAGAASVDQCAASVRAAHIN